MEKEVKGIRPGSGAVKGFLVFLGLMWICTLISKSVYASRLPRVGTDTPARRSIQHDVEAAGIVKQSGECAVNVEQGLRVADISVHPGDWVEEDTILFRIDTFDLQTIIEKKELEAAKLRRQVTDLEAGEEIAGKQQDTAVGRAVQDKESAQRQADTGRRRADAALDQSRQRLQEHESNGTPLTSREERDRRWEEYNNWASQEKTLQDAAASAESRETAARNRVEEAQKKMEEEERKLQGNSSMEGEAPPSPDGAETAEPPAGEQTAPSAEEQSASSPETAADAEVRVPAPASQPDAGTAASPEDGSGLEAARQELEAARAELAAAQEELAAAQAALTQHESNEISRPDFSSEDSARKAWETERESLEDSVQQAQYDREDAETAAEKARIQAERGVEDASMPGKPDSTLEITRMELEQVQKELGQYRTILEKEGEVTAGVTGSVTHINVKVGERTPDGAAVVCADSAEPWMFTLSLTREQKKYVNQGDTATLRLGSGAGREVTIDYLAENASDPSLYDAVVYLPEGVGSLGQGGTLKRAAVSGDYPCTIPVRALHKDNQEYYVYILEERDGILGKELTARPLYVTVLDQNEQYAALEDSALREDTVLIVSCDREITAGDVVRYQE